MVSALLKDLQDIFLLYINIAIFPLLLVFEPRYSVTPKNFCCKNFFLLIGPFIILTLLLSLCKRKAISKDLSKYFLKNLLFKGTLIKN